jgi:hypothetical protein
MTIAQKTSCKISLENAPEGPLLCPKIFAPRPCPSGGISPRLPTAAFPEKVDEIALCSASNMGLLRFVANNGTQLFIEQPRPSGDLDSLDQ